MALSLSFFSCTVTSKQALNGPGGRNSYNATLQMTTTEQMLLNLVRLRFCDIPYFLDVSTITTQFTYSTNASPNFLIPGFNNKNPFELGTGVSWQNQPTIQYTPLEGQAFATQLMRPIDILTIQQLLVSGWDVDRVFKLTIQSFDDLSNAPNAAGPVPDKIPDFQNFFEMTKLMRNLQLEGKLFIGSKALDDLERMQKMPVDPNSAAAAKESEKDDSKKCKHDTMRVIFPLEGENSTKLAGLLQSTRKNHKNYVVDVNLGFNRDAEVGIMPRSVLGCMYYLSLGVIPPQKDVASGNVPLVKDNNGKIYNWQNLLGGLFKVLSSQNYPENPFVAVKYRGSWYYIDNRDVASKRTMVLLQQIYSLQSGGESKQLPTLLTIPIGISK